MSSSSSSSSSSLLPSGLSDFVSSPTSFHIDAILNDGSNNNVSGSSSSNGGGGIVVLGHFGTEEEDEKEDEKGDACEKGKIKTYMYPALVKLRHAPLPREKQSLSQLLNACSLSPRLPYSGMEFAYYNATLNSNSNNNAINTAPYCVPLFTAEVICASALPQSLMNEEEKAKIMEKHIARSTMQQAFIIRESPDMYRNVHRCVMLSLISHHSRRQ